MKKMLPLILIIVAGAFFAFWYFQIREDKPANTQNNSQDNPVPNPTPPAQTPEEMKVNYFVIPEWGVKFPIEKQYGDDLEYAIFSHGITANFGSKRLAKTQPDCGGKENDVGINIGLNRDTNNKTGIYATYIKKLGDYHFFLMQPRHTVCDFEGKLSDTDGEYSALLGEALIGGLKNLEIAQ